MSETQPPRVLFCAFAEVPGPTANSTRIAQWLSVFGSRSVDALSLKGYRDPHIQRLGGARIMRVPNTTGKPHAERVSTYQRAVQRQLGADSYDLVWCADFVSAEMVAKYAPRVPMILEVNALPSMSLAADAQKRQRDLEKAIVKAASRVIVSSRYAARQLTERLDARNISIVPRCVDRTVFSPPSVEIAMDDEQRVLLLGGREGGPRCEDALATLSIIAKRASPTVRLGLLGLPTPGDAAILDQLAQKGLASRVEFIDADSSLAVSGAVSLAHVVVVPTRAAGEPDAFAVPHRALEAMSCGRAVVLAGAEASFKDALVSGEHAQVTSREPEAMAEAAMALLSQSSRREAMCKSAARHVEATADLITRSADLVPLVQEATGVTLDLHPPRDDDADTSSRSVPPRPMPMPNNKRNEAARTTPEVAHVAPLALPSEPSEKSGPAPGKSSLAAAAEALDELAAPRLKRKLPSSDSGSGPFARATPSGVTQKNPPASGGTPPASSPGATMRDAHDPLQTQRMDAPAFSHLEVPAGMWEGDTFLDSGAPQHESVNTNPDAERVKAAMLVSSDARSRDSKENPAPTSMIVASSIDSLEPVRSGDGDPWAPDTIADGTPIAPASIEPGARMPSAKSLLVDIDRPTKPITKPNRKTATVDVTAEDSEEDSEAGMSSSDESSPI